MGRRRSTASNRTSTGSTGSGNWSRIRKNMRYLNQDEPSSDEGPKGDESDFDLSGNLAKDVAERKRKFIQGQKALDVEDEDSIPVAGGAGTNTASSTSSTDVEDEEIETVTATAAKPGEGARERRLSLRHVLQSAPMPRELRKKLEPPPPKQGRLRNTGSSVPELPLGNGTQGGSNLKSSTPIQKNTLNETIGVSPVPGVPGERTNNLILTQKPRSKSRTVSTSGNKQTLERSASNDPFVGVGTNTASSTPSTDVEEEEIDTADNVAANTAAGAQELRLSIRSVHQSDPKPLEMSKELELPPPKKTSLQNGGPTVSQIPLLNGTQGGSKGASNLKSSTPMQKKKSNETIGVSPVPGVPGERTNNNLILTEKPRSKLRTVSTSGNKQTLERSASNDPFGGIRTNTALATPSADVEEEEIETADNVEFTNAGARERRLPIRSVEQSAPKPRESRKKLEPPPLKKTRLQNGASTVTEIPLLNGTQGPGGSNLMSSTPTQKNTSNEAIDVNHVPEVSGERANNPKLTEKPRSKRSTVSTSGNKQGNKQTLERFAGNDPFDVVRTNTASSTSSTDLEEEDVQTADNVDVPTAATTAAGGRERRLPIRSVEQSAAMASELRKKLEPPPPKKTRLQNGASTVTEIPLLNGTQGGSNLKSSTRIQKNTSHEAIDVNHVPKVSGEQANNPKLTEKPRSKLRTVSTSGVRTNTASSTSSTDVEEGGMENDELVISPAAASAEIEQNRRSTLRSVGSTMPNQLKKKVERQRRPPQKRVQKNRGSTVPEIPLLNNDPNGSNLISSIPILTDEPGHEAVAVSMSGNESSDEEHGRRQKKKKLEPPPRKRRQQKRGSTAPEMPLLNNDQGETEHNGQAKKKKAPPAPSVNVDERPKSRPVVGSRSSSIMPLGQNPDRPVVSLSQTSQRSRTEKRTSIFQKIREPAQVSKDKVSKGKSKKRNKTPERYVGNDPFGNYHLMKGADVRRILEQERPGTKLSEETMNKFSLKVNHFLEDFFVHHCEETTQPYGFIPFQMLLGGLAGQKLIPKHSSPDDLLKMMRKDLPREDWKRSEGVLIPSRFSKGSDTDDYLYK